MRALRAERCRGRDLRTVGNPKEVERPLLEAGTRGIVRAGRDDSV
jgi:hypothetical protein